MENSIKKIAREAYKTFLKNEVFFLMDSFDTSIEKKILRKQIIKSLSAMKKAFVGHKKMNVFNNARKRRSSKELTIDEVKKGFEKSQDNNAIEEFIIRHLDNKDKILQETFYTKLFNLTVMSTYLTMKYQRLNETRHLDQKRIVNNLATTFIENSYLGTNRDSFHPYYITNSMPSTRRSFYNPDFYTVQATYMQHILLMLVVLYKRWNLLPEIEFRKLGQQNIIPASVELLGVGTISHINKLPTYHYSLNDIIRNFSDILEDIKANSKNGNRAIIGNVYFSSLAISRLNYDKLINDDHYMIEEKNTHASTVQVRETIALCFEDLIQKSTVRQARVWGDVRMFMDILNIRVPKRKNKKMNFFDMSIIGIKNAYGDTFFIKPMLTDKNFQKSNIYKKMTNLFQKHPTSDMSYKNFMAAYTFESSVIDK